MIQFPAKVYTPETQELDNPDGVGVFLAGTIEMGNSPDWQARAVRRLQDLDVSIYNPRRVVAPDEDLIAAQITWELNSIAKCQFIFMHFAANTVSPISLYELGLLQGNHRIGQKRKSIVVACDPLYSRVKNVKVTLTHPHFKNQDIHFTHSFERGLIEMRKQINASLQFKNF